LTELDVEVPATTRLTDSHAHGESRLLRRDAQRTAQLVLASIWLLDAVLQIQPFMFTRGSDGFSGMLNEAAAGNPGLVFRTVSWNASIVYHHPVLTNTVYALIQFTIGFGIAYKRTLRPALALSIVWSLGVWWFGEGAGGIFLGTATPLGGGPGGVLYYALIALLLWPRDRRDSQDQPFVAARSIGAPASRAVWAGTWVLLAVLSVVGSGRRPQALHDLVSDLAPGEPGWVAHLDRISESFFNSHGTLAAVLLGIVCLFAAASVYASPRVARFMIVVVVATFAVIWLAVQNLGGMLIGGATDPNSGPLVVLLALIFWPLDRQSSPVALRPLIATSIAMES